MLENQNRKKKYCWRFWPFFKRDYKYIASYLEDREKKGYRFCSLGCVLPVARYEKVEAKETRYEVDVFHPKEYIEIQPYLDVCEDSGWEICWQWDEYKIFRAADGKSPIPLQTDWEIKREQEKEVLKRNTRGILAVFAWFSFLVFILYKVWNWPEFYIDTLDMQGIIGLLSVAYIGSFILVLYDLYQGYCFYHNEIAEDDLNSKISTDMIKHRVKRNVLFKAICCSIITGFWFFMMIAYVLGNFSWGSIIGWIIGMFFGITYRVSTVKSEWPKKRKMKGVYSKKYRITAVGVLLILSVGMYFCINTNKEAFLNNNFYMSHISKTENFYSFGYGGSCVFEARSKKTADKMWAALDQEIRSAETAYIAKYEEKEVALPERKILADEERKRYGDYDKGIVYPQRERVLLRKENIICITDKIS